MLASLLSATQAKTKNGIFSTDAKMPTTHKKHGIEFYFKTHLSKIVNGNFARISPIDEDFILNTAFLSSPCQNFFARLSAEEYAQENNPKLVERRNNSKKKINQSTNITMLRENKINDEDLIKNQLRNKLTLPSLTHEHWNKTMSRRKRLNKLKNIPTLVITELNHLNVAGTYLVNDKSSIELKKAQLKYNILLRTITT